ncbi:hypothetical protein BT63DRAFT_401500 [Microthyrium microscopicum]|uniref:PRISE-like Rossmann-fold domain-containing protein n=1 Tax=Microthyrium microscopicum TaxID=703497 RepID=A0A6A6UEN0_9PEZI|nr:hypothetical protein BT63DRAFT_401500 [Microthyrium microscopicum]
MTGNHALIFGASGITGWAIVNQLLKGYPSPNDFSRITALTNRPLKHEETLWPKSDKLLLTTANLMHDGGQAGLEKDLKEKVKDIDTVSHVFFFECEINVTLIDRAVKTIENLSKNLTFVVLPTGTKAYGVHLIEKFPFPEQLPMAESLPRIPEPYASEMFYYDQLDYLTKASKGKSWSWCEVIPDVIIGFVPNNNIYCLPQILGLYLSLYRYHNGKDAEVAFPGTSESWKILSNDSPQDQIACFSIYASLNPKKCGDGQRFNTAVSEPSSWSEKWPVICSYFGLKGVAPPAGGSGPQPTQYLEENASEWQKVEEKYKLVKGRVGNQRTFGGFPYFIMTMFNFDRHLDMSKFNEVWSDKEQLSTTFKDAWYTAFDRFKSAGIIPQF